MFQRIKNWRKSRRLRSKKKTTRQIWRDYQKTRDYYDERISAADSMEEVEELRAEAGHHVFQGEEEWQTADDSVLLLEAERLRVEEPSHNDKEMWEMNQYSRGMHLSQKGVEKIRASIRAERKARREPMTTYVTWFGAIAASIAAIAAIVAAIKAS